jgi:hypothetical protein
MASRRQPLTRAQAAASSKRAVIPVADRKAPADQRTSAAKPPAVPMELMRLLGSEAAAAAVARNPALAATMAATGKRHDEISEGDSDDDDDGEDLAVAHWSDDEDIEAELDDEDKNKNDDNIVPDDRSSEQNDDDDDDEEAESSSGESEDKKAEKNDKTLPPENSKQEPSGGGNVAENTIDELKQPTENANSVEATLKLESLSMPPINSPEVYAVAEVVVRQGVATAVRSMLGTSDDEPWFDRYEAACLQGTVEKALSEETIVYRLLFHRSADTTTLRGCGFVVLEELARRSVWWRLVRDVVVEPNTCYVEVCADQEQLEVSLLQAEIDLAALETPVAYRIAVLRKGGERIELPANVAPARTVAVIYALLECWLFPLEFICQRLVGTAAQQNLGRDAATLIKRVHKNMPTSFVSDMLKAIGYAQKTAIAVALITQ